MGYVDGEYREDCGFEEPDLRWESYTSEGHIQVKIVRNYKIDVEDDELDYDCSFDILKDGTYYMRDIPSEDKAIKVAKILFDIEE